MARERMEARDWLLLILLSIIWGGSFLFMGILVRELPPLTIAALRLLIAATLLDIVFRSHIKFLKSMWKDFLVLGTLNNTVPYSLILWAQLHIPSSLASMLNSTSPFFTSIMAHFLTEDEKLTLKKVSGIILGLSGVFLIFASNKVDSVNLSFLGQLSVISAVICYSYATIYGRKFYSRGLPATAVASGQLNLAAITTAPIALALERPWNIRSLSQNSIGALVGLSVISTALAYLIFFKLLEASGATNTNLVTLLIPVTATLLCTAFLGEELEFEHLAGMTVIALGLLITDGRLFDWLKAMFFRLIEI